MNRYLEMHESFYCANRYATILTGEKQTFKELATKFSVPATELTKDGPGIFPAHYTAPYRQLQYIDYHNFIILDIDKPEEAHKILNSDLQSIAEFNYVIYSTHSSTSENPRLRVIIEANDFQTQQNEHITIDDYSAATRTIEHALGVIADPFSHHRNSFVFIPRVKPRAHFIFKQNLECRQFTKSDIEPSFYRQKSASEEFKQFVKDSAYDPEEIPHDVLKAMLAAIPPDDYDTWLKVMAGVHHHSGGAMWGFDIINEWSSKSNKYEGPEDIWYRWESFKDDREDLSTIGTVIFLANQNEWQSKQSHLIASAIRERMSKNKEQFISELVAFTYAEEISRYPLTPVTRQSLVEELTDYTAKMMSLKGKSKRLLEQAIADKAQYGGSKHGVTEDERLARTPNWMRDFVIVLDMTPELKFTRISDPFDPSDGVRLVGAEQFNTAHRVHMAYQGEDLATRAKDEFVIPHVDKVAFNPGAPSIFVNHDGRKCLNAYVNDESFPHKNPNDLSPAQATLFQQIDKFMRYFAPNDKQRHILLNYLAFNVFSPGEKVLWVPYVITTEGYGKDTLMHMLEASLGKHKRYYLKIDGNKFFDTRWTSSLEHRGFIYVNEIYTGLTANLKTAEAIYNNIKDLFTQNDAIRISVKFQNDRYVAQTTNYFLSTNSWYGLVYPKTERRLFVLRPEVYHENIEKSRAAITPEFNAIWHALSMLGVGNADIRKQTPQSIQYAVRETLLSYFHQYYGKDNWDSDFNPKGRAFITPEFLDTVEITDDSNSDIIHEILEDPDYIAANQYYVCFSLFQEEIHRRCQARNRQKAPDARHALAVLGYENISSIVFENAVLNSVTSNRIMVSSLFANAPSLTTLVYVSKPAKQFIYQNQEQFSDMKRYIQVLQVLEHERQKLQKAIEFQLEHIIDDPDQQHRYLN